jgi:hypothetical protein
MGGSDLDTRPLRIEVTFTTQEPTRGMFVRRMFWLGTKEDPKAERPDTRRSRDWTEYKNYLKAAGIQPTGDTEEEAVMVRGAKLVGKVGTRKYAKKTDGLDADGKQIKSGVDNTVWDFFMVGTKEVGFTDSRKNANGLDTTAAVVSRSMTGRALPRFLSDDE